MTRRASWWTLVLFVIVGLGAGYFAWSPIKSRTARTEYPYVVVVSLDTLHVSYSGLYNREGRGMSHLDELGRNGVVFQHAYTRVPITLPSHATLFSGQTPMIHGAIANGDVVPTSVDTLAETFQEAGYQTAAFVSLGVLGREFGLEQGFDVYDDPFGQSEARIYRYAHEVFEPLRAWLDRSHENPFFLWVHLSDPHEPYVPVGAPPDTRLTLDGDLEGEWSLVGDMKAVHRLTLPPGHHELTWTSLRGERPDDRPETCIRLEWFDPGALSSYTSSVPVHGVDLRPSWSMELTNPHAEDVELELTFGGRLIRPAPSDVLDNYQMEVDYTDRYLGEIQKLLESLGISEEVLWVVVSDHGEGLFRHDVLGHAEFTFEDQLRIIWLLNGPGLPKGEIIDSPVLMEDVAPTLLDIVGLPVTERAEGIAMTSCWREGNCPKREEWWSYGMRHEPSQLTSLAGHRWPFKWQWRRGEGRQAFALVEDPWEETDLLLLPGPERPDEIKELAEDFRRMRVRHQNLIRQRPDSGDPERRMELLRSLGYVDPRQQ